MRLPIEQYHSQKNENPKQLAVKIEKPMECSTEPVKHVMTPQEQNKYFMENFLRIPHSIFRIKYNMVIICFCAENGNQIDQTNNKNRNIDVSLKDKKGNLLKEEIKRLDQEIKHEEIEKTKEFVTLQNILNSRIADKSKSANVKNPHNMIIPNDLCNEKTNIKTEPQQYQSVKNLTQKV